MAKLSRQTKEIIQIVVFLLVVGTLVLVYVIYPLNRTKDIFARENIDDYNNDSLVVNDPTPYVEAGLSPDTFRVESEGNANLACLYLPGDADTARSEPVGTVLLSHREYETRDSLIWLADQLVDSGWTVITFDQRATGLSTGLYHGEGIYEGHHIEDIIAYADVRDWIVHPLVAVGFGRSADGVLIAADEDPRIDIVMAIQPYLTTTRMLNILKDRYDMFWFPFFRTVMWFWYQIRSGYEGEYRSREDLLQVDDRTLLYFSPELAKSETVVYFINQSDTQLISAQAAVPTDEEILGTIMSFEPEESGPTD